MSVLSNGTVSTNVYLRRLQNFCIGMNWLPWPVLPHKLFPTVKHTSKRAITLEEHQKIIAREGNAERRAFYELLWHLGGAQSDIACLEAEDIDWNDSTRRAIRSARCCSPKGLCLCGDRVRARGINRPPSELLRLGSAMRAS